MPIPIREHPLFIMGKKEGKLEARKENLLEFIRYMFGKVPRGVKKKIMSAESLEELDVYETSPRRLSFLKER